MVFLVSSPLCDQRPFGKHHRGDQESGSSLFDIRIDSPGERTFPFSFLNPRKINTVVACRYELASLFTSLGELDEALRVKSFLFELPFFGSESWEYANHH